MRNGEQEALGARRQAEAALEEKESQEGQRWEGCGNPSNYLLLGLPAVDTSWSLWGTWIVLGWAPAGLAVRLPNSEISRLDCRSGSLTPGLLWESRGEAGLPGAFSGSNDFSSCPQNKCTTDKTVWSGAEELL